MVKKMVMVTAFLQQVLMPIPSKKKWKMSLKLSATIITRRDIILAIVSKKIQKTCVGLDNLDAADWN